MIEIRRASMEDVAAVTPQALQRDETWEGYEGMEEDSCALVVDGRVIACFGVAPMHEGNGFAWVVLSDEAIRDHPVACSTVAYRELLRHRVRKGLWRIEAVAMVDNPRARAWLERMGFEVEGRKRKFGPNGEDYWALARVWE